MEKLQPELRFPEFEGDWNTTAISSLLEFKNGINAGKESYGFGRKFINVLDILNNNFITHDVIVGSVDIHEDLAKKYEVGYGDILFQRSSETREEVGTANVYLDKHHSALFGGFIIRGKKIAEYIPTFFNYLLKTDIARESITSKSGGSTRYNVGQNILNQVSLPFPSLPEQTKIAEFLTAIDKRIELLTAKKEKLTLYKKGVMQKIFNQEIRFKPDDGGEFPEWEEKRLGEVCEVTSSKRVYLSNYVEMGIPFYRGKEISELKLGITPRDILYITEESYLNFKNTFGAPKKGDLLITAVGTIGNTLSIKRDDPFYFKDGNLIWLRNLTLVIPEFLEYYFDFKKVDIMNLSSGSTQKALTIVALKLFIVKIPRIEEQTKITDFLLSLDTEIQKVEQQITLNQKYKKGLLQKMFV